MLWFSYYTPLGGTPLATRTSYEPKGTNHMFLITGATGLVGRPLIDLLVDAGASVRAVTRDQATADLPPAVDVVEADPSRPATIATHLQGVHAVFVNPRSVGTAADELMAIARANGVRRVVTMSALNVDWDLDWQPSRLRGEYNKETEAAAAGSGLEWVALRSGCYAMNAATSWASQVRNGDVVRSPFADAEWAPIHEGDVAAVGAHALLTDQLIGQRPVLTGPRSLTQADMVAAIAQAIDRPLRYVDVAADAAQQGMVRAGMPEAIAAGFLRLQAESYGQKGLVTGEVERILGRPGRTFAEWAVAHAADFQR